MLIDQASTVELNIKQNANSGTSFLCNIAQWIRGAVMTRLVSEVQHQLNSTRVLCVLQVSMSRPRHMTVDHTV